MCNSTNNKAFRWRSSLKADRRSKTKTHKQTDYTTQTTSKRVSKSIQQHYKAVAMIDWVSIVRHSRRRFSTYVGTRPMRQKRRHRTPPSHQARYQLSSSTNVVGGGGRDDNYGRDNGNEHDDDDADASSSPTRHYGCCCTATAASGVSFVWVSCLYMTHVVCCRKSSIIHANMYFVKSSKYTF